MGSFSVLSTFHSQDDQLPYAWFYESVLVLGSISGLLFSSGWLYSLTMFLSGNTPGTLVLFNYRSGRSMLRLWLV